MVTWVWLINTRSQVLADGTVVDTLSTMRKDNTGGWGSVVTATKQTLIIN